MNKMYLVKEYLNSEEPSIIGVCPSRELAEALRQKSVDSWNLENCEITQQEYDDMLIHIYTEGMSEGQSIEEAMVQAYPEYSITDITKACHYYMDMSYIDTIIEEIDFFENENDIISYGTNS